MLKSLNEKLKKGQGESPFYVGLVVMNDKKQILLGKRTEDGIWTGPGGGADPGESPAKAAIREAFEEANLRLYEHQLKELPTLVAENGKMIHCFLVRVFDFTYTDAKNDPDREVKKWDWYEFNDLPKDLGNDINRITCVNNGKMRALELTKSLVDKLQKGGVGSGRVGHHGITDSNKQIPFRSHDHNYVQTGWTHKDHQNAMNHHYELSNKMRSQLDGILDRHDYKNLNPTARAHKEKIEDKISHHVKESEIHRQRMMRLQERAEETQKSEVQMDLVGTSVETGHYSSDLSEAVKSDYLEKIQITMENFDYGDAPRSISLDNGCILHLVKVDEGLYSGYVDRDVEDPEGLPEGVGRIERQTIPTLIQYLKAKEFIDPAREIIRPVDLSEKLVELQEPEPEIVPVSSGIDKKIRMLELIEKLVGA